MAERNKVQKVIDAALNEQALECYEALCETMAEKLVAPIQKISESVSNSFFMEEEEVETEDYESRRAGEKKPKKTVVKESYDGLDPQVQRAVDFVVEGVTRKGISQFGSLVEAAEERFAIYNDDLKNYFAESVKSVQESSHIGAIKDYIGGKTEKQKDKEAVNSVFGPRPKKTAAQRRAGKKFVTRKY